MSGTSLFFVASDRTSAIARALIDVRDRIESPQLPLHGDVDVLEIYLSSRDGAVVVIDFADGHEAETILPVSAALDALEIPHFGYWPSRDCDGAISAGGYAYRLPRMTERSLLAFPWEEGEPTPLDQDMKTAGFDDEDMAMVIDLFYGSTAPMKLTA